MSRRIVLVDIGNAMVLRGVLPSVAVGASYNASVTASGGAAPYTYTITAGADALTAAGIQLDPATGIFSASSVSGAGNIPITVRATGINGAYVQRQFVVTVIAEPLVLTITGTYPAATVGTAYSADLVITNGVQPYSNPRVIAGTLPAWASLEIVGDKLRLSGTPTGSETTVNITVAVDSFDDQMATSAQSIAVSAAISLATWDPARHGPTVVLSNDNLDATVPVYNGYSILAATTPHSSGKWIFQIDISELSSGDNNWFIGLCAIEGTLPAPWGDGAYLGSLDEHSAGIGWFPYSGEVYYISEQASVRGINAGAGLAVMTSVVVTVAVDLDSSTKTIQWFVGDELKRSFDIPAEMSARDWLPAATMLQSGNTFRINAGQTPIVVPAPLAGLGYHDYWG